MSFLDKLKSFIVTTEADVLKIVTAIKADLAVAEADINSALHWIASNAPTIAADIQEVAGIAVKIGVTSNPDFAAAVTAANLAVTGLNAFAAASNSGQNNAEAVLAGYAAVKQAQSAVASATAAMVQSPTLPVAPSA